VFIIENMSPTLDDIAPQPRQDANIRLIPDVYVPGSRLFLEATVDLLSIFCVEDLSNDPPASSSAKSIFDLFFRKEGRSYRCAFVHDGTKEVALNHFLAVADEQFSASCVARVVKQKNVCVALMGN
jgi:hypothetical protein